MALVLITTDTGHLIPSAKEGLHPILQRQLKRIHADQIITVYCTFSQARRRQRVVQRRRRATKCMLLVVVAESMKHARPEARHGFMKGKKREKVAQKE